MTIDDMIPGNTYILEYLDHIEKVFCTRKILSKSEQRFGEGFYIGVKFFNGNTLSRIEHTLFETKLGESYKVSNPKNKELA